MNKPKTQELPPFKPWCVRVARTVTKKRGARENWPRDVRDAHAAKRKAKRKERRDPKEEEMWLRAESKRGGIDADVARMKLRALKQRKIIDAEELRRELVTRIVKFRESRGLASKDVASAQSQTQTIAVTKSGTST